MDKSELEIAQIEAQDKIKIANFGSDSAEIGVS